MMRFARILSSLPLLSALSCGSPPKSNAAAATPPPQVTLPDSCAWLDMKSALGVPSAAVRITGFCVHEEVASVATETYSYTDGGKTLLAVRDVNERTLATRLKGKMIGPRGVEVPLDVHTSFTDVAYSTPHGSLAFKGTTLAELDAKIAKDLADKIREELDATSAAMAEKH